jgi:hypothetical protein
MNDPRRAMSAICIIAIAIPLVMLFSKYAHPAPAEDVRIISYPHAITWQGWNELYQGRK